LGKKLKQKIKQKNYNLELRLKREQQKIELRDFPLSVRIKPTAHKQYCYLCRKPIGKDTHQIMLNSGYWYTFVKDSKVQGGGLEVYLLFLPLTTRQLHQQTVVAIYVAIEKYTCTQIVMPVYLIV
jgi:hypothetical protein